MATLFRANPLFASSGVLNSAKAYYPSDAIHVEVILCPGGSKFIPNLTKALFKRSHNYRLVF